MSIPAQNFKYYKELKNLIDERQSFEAKHPEKPYSDAKTDLNFKDIHDYSLLNYAIFCEDLDEVKRLVSQGANISDDDIMQALNQDYLPIAEWLFNQAATCYEVKLTELTTEAGKNWLKNKIDDEIAKYIDEKNNFTILPGSKLFRIAPNEKATATDYITIPQTILLKRYTEANNWKYFDFLCQSKRFFLDPMTLANIIQHANAFKNKTRIDDLWKLTEKLKPHESAYVKTFGIRDALLGCHQREMVDYLLGKGADINLPVESYAGNTVLGEAIELNPQDLDTIKYLISKGSDISKVNCRGQSILHLAAQRGDEEIDEYIQSLDLPKDFAELKDIFGKTAEDYRQLQIRVSLSQSTLYKHLHYFLRLDYCPENPAFQRGICNGLGRLYHLYPPEYFFNTIRLINAWDGSKEALLRPFSDDHPQKKFYKNLKELMKTWSSQIILTQAWDIPDSFQIKQSDRIKQHQFLTDKTGQLPIYLYRLSDFFSNLEKIEEILDYFYKMPAKARIEFSDSHLTTAYLAAKDHIDYYDCNFPLDTAPLKQLDTFKNLILNARLKLYDAYLHLGNLISESISIYIHTEDEAAFKQQPYQLLSQTELPKSKEEADAFQNRSPNKFTPLHIAIMGRDAVMLEKLLHDKYYDINALDDNNQNALSLAIQSNFSKGVELLLAEKDINLSIMNDNDMIAESFPFVSPNILNSIVTHKDPSPLPFLSRYALFYENEPLVDLLVKHNKFKATDSDLTVALILALRANPPNQKMMTFLMKQGVSITVEPLRMDCDQLNCEKISPYQFAKKKGGACLAALIQAASATPFDEKNPPPKGTILLLREAAVPYISDNTLMHYLCDKAVFYTGEELKQLIATIKKEESTEYKSFILRMLNFSITNKVPELFDDLLKSNIFTLRELSEIFKNIVNHRSTNDSDFILKLINKGFDIKRPISTPSYTLYGMKEVMVSPIVYAIKRRADSSLVKVLLDAGANLDEKDNYYNCSGRELLYKPRC